MFRNFWLVAVAMVAATTTPAAAATITYSGTGTVGSVEGTLAPTGSAGLGSDFRFSLDYDTDAVRFFAADDFEAAYDVPVSAFSARIGGYDFVQSADPKFVPTLVLYRAFMFLGGTSSTPVLVAQLYLTGVLQPGGSTASPFAIPAGQYDTLVIASVFVANEDDTALGFDQFRDPALAVQRDFSYQVNAAPRRFGRLTGDFDGGFSSAAAVPEPATWVMTLVGFMLLGAASRTRRTGLVPLPA